MSRYEYEGNRTYAVDDDGQRTLLANFVATIVEETRYVDEMNSETWLAIDGIMPGEYPDDHPPDFQPEPIQLPRCDIDATQFPGMTWVMQNWGVRAIIQVGSGTKDELRAAIQNRSKPKVSTIYRHIGWQKIEGKPAYLHAAGGITAKGNDTTIRVELPAELALYSLPKPNTDTLKAAVLAALKLAELAPPRVSWPLLAGTVAPLFGPVDFAMHVAGRTGTFKSELMSLYQSFYGPGMDSRHLPGSWSSTANALEAQAYYAANAVFVVDDFVPIGTSNQIRAYQTTADKLIRSQGNQSGRARLTDTSSLQTTMYPRGIIFSTGEDTPEGHSVRARMLILELTPGDIDKAALTAAQNARPMYCQVTSTFIQYLAVNRPKLNEITNGLRDGLVNIGHSRTPPMLGRLIASIGYFLEWCVTMKCISKEEAKKYTDAATSAIVEAGQNQQQYLESADPVEMVFVALRKIFASGKGHARTTNGGIPAKPTLLGWTEDNAYGQNDVSTYKPHGPCIAWTNWPADELYLDTVAGFAALKKEAGADLSLSQMTLMKRLKDAGQLKRTEDNRQRNTIRVKAENHTRTVMCLFLSAVLDSQEAPADEQQSVDGRSDYDDSEPATGNGSTVRGK